MAKGDPMKRTIGISAVSAIAMVSVLSGCSIFVQTIPEPADDEIQLLIQLDVKEDIGLLVVDYDQDGVGGSGGTSNADKSLIKHDELIVYTLEREYFGDAAEGGVIAVQFTVITEYENPNYENIYSAENTKTMNAIYLDADYGKSYSIRISGDRTDGYTAVLED